MSPDVGKEGGAGGGNIIGEKVPNAGKAVRHIHPTALVFLRTVTCPTYSADQSLAAVGLRGHAIYEFQQREGAVHRVECARLAALQSIPTPDGLGGSNV